MNAHSIVQKIGERLPSADERAAANQLRKIIADQLAGEGDGARLTVGAPGAKAEIVLAPALAQLLMELLRHIGQGDAVTLVPISQMLTTQQAADILNVSRPHLVSLLEKGEIPHSLVGRHRRVRAEDLFRYKEARDRTRQAALAQLADLDADLI